MLTAADPLLQSKQWGAPFDESFSISASTMLGVLLFMLASERQAHAYTDPGSGMLIWQGVVAAFLGASFYFRKFFFKFFR